MQTICMLSIRPQKKIPLDTRGLRKSLESLRWRAATSNVYLEIHQTLFTLDKPKSQL